MTNVIRFPRSRVPDRIVDLAERRPVRVGPTMMSRRVAVDLMANILRQYWGRPDAEICEALSAVGFNPGQMVEMGPEAVGIAKRRRNEQRGVS